MRIVMSHVYSWPEVRRGAERYTHELAAALLRAGHQVRIVTTGERAGNDVVLGVPVQRLRRRGSSLRRRYAELSDQVAFGAQAAGRLATARVDVWHAVSIPDAAAAAVTGRLRPGLRSVFSDCGFPVRASRAARPDHRMFRTAVRLIDEYVCQSTPAALALERDYGRRPHVVPAGVDVERFSPGGERHGRPVLMFVGAVDVARKNAPRFLEALALLRRDGHGVDGWLIGPGELPVTISPLAQEGLAAVTVRRSVPPDDLADPYRQAWVTVLPSEAELFGLVVLESLACGTPAVVLDDGLGPATLISPGTGVRSGATARELASSCLAALDLVASPGTVEACVERATEFSWDTRVVPELVAIYRGDA